MKTIIMCIGNREGGDDAVGPYICDKLKKTKIKTVDCGTIPENYTSIVKKEKPDKLIIIDAVEMGEKPGETRKIPKDKIGVMTISTHGIPLSVLIGYLEQYIQDITLIGIQPETMNGEITKNVKNKADELIEIIKNQKTNEIHSLK